MLDPAAPLTVVSLFPPVSSGISIINCVCPRSAPRGKEVLNQFKMFDSHFHIIDKRFPLVPNNGYVPEEFTCEDYLKKTSAYELCGGAVVSGSFQAFDQSYLIDALDSDGAIDVFSRNANEKEMNKNFHYCASLLLFSSSPHR